MQSVDVQKQLNKDKVHSVQWFEYVKRIKSNHEKSVRKLKALHDMELKARGVEPMALVFASRLHHMYESAQERLVAEDEDEEDDSLYEHQMAFEDLKDAALELEGEIELAQKEKEERDLLMSMEASASVNRSGTSSQPLDDSPDPSPPVRHNSNSRRQSLPLDDTADEAEREREIEAIANRSGCSPLLSLSFSPRPSSFPPYRLSRLLSYSSLFPSTILVPSATMTHPIVASNIHPSIPTLICFCRTGRVH